MNAPQPLRKIEDDRFCRTMLLPMRTVSLAASMAQLMRSIPQSLIDYPSMMSVDEKRFLYNIAKSWYKGDGRIVDAGIFLGASTKCFATGLHDNISISSSSKLSKPIQSYDLAIVNPGMPAFFERHDVKVEAKVGETFASYLFDAIKEFETLVDLHIGDVTETIETLEGQVEIAFLDVLKLPSVSTSVISKVFPLLIPGRSIVIQQDYFNEHLDFIKTQQEMFGDCFIYLGEIGCSAVFQCTREITPAMIAERLETASIEDQERFASIAMHRSIDPTRRYLMAISKARLINRTRGSDAALAYLSTVKSDFPKEVLGGGKVRRLDKVMEIAERQCSRN